MEAQSQLFLALVLLLGGSHARSAGGSDNGEVIKLCETLEPECVKKLDTCGAIMTPDKEMKDELQVTALACVLKVTGIDISKATSLPRMGDIPTGLLKNIKVCLKDVMTKFVTAVTSNEAEGVRTALLKSFDKCDMIGMRSCMLKECMDAL
ncbi:uncharacterized protein LOC122248836 [Penaeus japonicus]|uniref:uncharacterized protein LOC122248836 n=1 Tax=Penaeus japonicus TaxID=27405 RepID=UPI001C71104F|nr:uncharacterized protein LOC122248836 [Penaeus japonicus]XP_042865095.1 uncharacterized protein LOC122248836 [Penaeus japonicus]XP_042865096.1 uncharacterized protein LOC122248836 [Penaeus japonicus]